MADTINVLSLCSGVGMLDLGVSAGLDFLGFRSRTLGYCERDAYAAACLMARMEDESLERAPVFCGDMRDLDAGPLRPYADLVCAGLPCQPYSCAGKKEGNSDRRSWGEGDGPIPQFLRIVSECQPSLVFLENVPAWVRGGWFRPVGEELCGMGFRLARPLFVTAESVGASHRRERVFILACRSSDGAEWWRLPKSDRWNDAANLDRRGDALGDAECSRASAVPARCRSRRAVVQSSGSVGIAERRSGRCDQPGRRSDRRTVAGRAGAAMADTECARSQGTGLAESERGGEPRACHSDRGIFAPGPGGNWREVPEHLWPAIEPGFRVLVDGRAVVVDASRADQLRCGGNGCVPLAAAIALVELFETVTQPPATERG